MNEKQKAEAVASVKSFKNWFTLDFSIKLFGVEIIAWHFPPLNERKDFQK